MIKEDYVSFDTAKMLKEKGFEEPIGLAYWDDGTEIGLSNPIEQIKQQAHHIVFKPTLQMAMKWLREVHNHIIVPGIRVEDPISGLINCYIVGIWYIPKNSGGAFCYTSPTPYNGYPSFEEACEAAIKYCLENLI